MHPSHHQGQLAGDARHPHQSGRGLHEGRGHMDEPHLQAQSTGEDDVQLQA